MAPHLWPALLAIGAHPTLDRALVLRYVEAVGDLESIRADWVLRGSPSVVARPAGDRAHPDLATMRSLASDVGKFATMLGLSPRSRKVLDVEVGVAAVVEPAGGEALTADEEIVRKYFN